MKNYKIVLKSIGAITQLPDSQKVFGALITTFAEANGNDRAAKLVKAVIDKKIHLALSNVNPLDYFPMPQDYVVDLLAKLLIDGESLKKKRAAIKERAYVRLEDLKRVIENPGIGKTIYPYIKQTDEQQLRASMDSVLYGIQGLETKLYTVPILKLTEKKRVEDQETGQPVSQFCFYLQMDESELGAAVLDLVKEWLHSGTSLILGKRSSQGLNTYHVIAMEPIELPNEEYYLNLGMLLPNKIDFGTSTLKLFTSERRPFAMQGGWNQECRKYFISFGAAGSVIAISDGVEQAGKCIPSPFNKSRDIVFGNAFLYPISLEKGGAE